jgi:hypothetical protein
MIATRASLQSWKPVRLMYLAGCLLASVVLIAYLRQSNSVPEMLGVSATLVFLESSMVFGALASSRWLLA